MNSFFNNPFLPGKKASMVILDGRVNNNIIESFCKLGVDVILTEANSSLYSAISYHPDILLHPVSQNRIVVNPQISKNFCEKLRKIGYEIIFGESVLGSNYPKNIAYNVARVGSYALHNIKYTDRVLRQELESIGVKFVNVRQGYTKCSTALVSENAIITSDNGIAKVADNYNIDCLLIQPGNISLPGLDYGFIGGACGLISRNTMAFTGRFTDHMTFEKICEFLNKYNVDSTFLSSEDIFDIGSIITVK